MTEITSTKLNTGLHGGEQVVDIMKGSGVNVPNRSEFLSDEDAKGVKILAETIQLAVKQL